MPGRLFNFGSLCTDFVYRVPQLVQAGQTLTSTSREVFAGGKGLNQSIAARLAGIDVHHYGAVGNDGEALLQTLQHAHVDISGVIQLDSASGHAVIQVDDHGRNAIFISAGTNRQIPLQLVEQMLDRMEPGDWLLLQNETNHVADLIQSASERGIPVALNFAPAVAQGHQLPLNSLHLLVVNEDEANALVPDSSDLREVFVQLCQRYPTVSIVLTRGGSGLWARDANTDVSYEYAAHSVTAADETAAGDAFVGYLMAALVNNATLSEALPLASAAGAIAVTRAGAAPSIPSKEEAQTLAEAHPLVSREMSAL